MRCGAGNDPCKGQRAKKLKTRRRAAHTRPLLEKPYLPADLKLAATVPALPKDDPSDVIADAVDEMLIGLER